MNGTSFPLSIRLWNVILLVSSGAILCLMAQEHCRLESYIENPKIFAENHQPPHVPLIPHPILELARQDIWTGSPLFLSLDGPWRFTWLRAEPTRTKVYFPGDRSANLERDSCWL